MATPDRKTEGALRAAYKGVGCESRGTKNRRILIDETVEADGVRVNWMLHATKGWRRRSEGRAS